MNKIIPALDIGKKEVFELLEKLETVKSKVGGYKVGSLLVMENSIEILAKLKEKTDVPIIYDGQKLGTDIPDIIEKQVELLAKTGVDKLITAPMGSGRDSLERFANICFKCNIEPICVTNMTQSNAEAYLLIASKTIILDNALRYGIQQFVYPATKPEILEHHIPLLQEYHNVTLMATGFKVQGGKTEVLRELGVTEFIIGRAIYDAKDPVQTVINISDEINKK